MCGIYVLICEKFNFSGNFLPIRCRGPDCSVMIMTEKEVLAFHRLAIVDQSFAGQQPMIDGNVKLLCNGEIYNYKNLIAKYNLHCTSHCDTEVILRLYQKYGMKKTVSLLYGVFAIVLLDKDMVYIARDRIGVRPLFYGRDDDKNLIIASEVKALTTCVRVEPVRPSSIVTYNRKGRVMKCERYYNIDEFPDQILPYGNMHNHIKLLVDKAVEKRLMGDRPIGCLLSGGLDSSIVTSILKKKLGQIRTYSIGMEGSVDLKYAKKVANYLKTDHVEISFTPEQACEIIPKIIYTIESYDITSVRASIGMYFLAKYISEHSEDRIIFSGEGADELFCGYLYFHYAPTTDELNIESLRLIKDLYKYDVLRADRCIAAHGLELRVPFLDQELVEYVLGLPGDVKKPKNNMEKYILRKAYEGELPEEVLWRRKDGFSDAVSSLDKPLYKYIQDFIAKEHGHWMEHDCQYGYDYKKDFPSAEAYYYYSLYNKKFLNYTKPIDYYWMPKWIESDDPSGRALKIYDEK